MENAAEETRPVKIARVTVSTPVVYLVNGDLRQALPAIVAVPGEEGVVDLHHFLKHGTGTRPVKGVRHLKDPRNLTDPTWVGQTGAWLSQSEYAAMIDEQNQAKRDQEMKRHVDQMKAQNERIVRYGREGMQVSQIAATVGVSPQLVDKVLADNGITQPEPAHA